MPAAVGPSSEAFCFALPFSSTKNARVAPDGAVSRASTKTSTLSDARCNSRNPPPPIPDAKGSTTASAAATATAASKALPPAPRISHPALVASACAAAIPHSCAAAGRSTLAAMNARTRRNRMNIGVVFMLALYESSPKCLLYPYQNSRQTLETRRVLHASARVFVFTRIFTRFALRLRWLLYTEPCRVKCRHEQQLEYGRGNQPAHDGDGHRSPEIAARQRNHRQHGGKRGQHDRPEAPHGGVDDRIPLRVPRLDVLLDLVHQNHRVAHDHAEQRDDTQVGDKAERHVPGQQDECHADQPERGSQQHHDGLLETLELDHQQSKHRNQHQRHYRDDRILALGTFLDGAGHFDAVVLGQLGAQGVELRLDLLGYHRRLDVAARVGAHGDGRLPVAAPDYALFEAVFYFRDLRQRNPLSRLRGHVYFGRAPRP